MTKPRILHRDLKGANILYNSHGDFKIADFGLSRTISTFAMATTQGKGTPGFNAPEVLQPTNGDSYGTEADVFSFAMVMYETLSTKPPYWTEPKYNYNQYAVNNAIVNGERPSLDLILDRDEESITHLVQLMKKCWAAFDRPAMTTVVEELKTLVEKDPIS